MCSSIQCTDFYRLPTIVNLFKENKFIGSVIITNSTSTFNGLQLSKLTLLAKTSTFEMYLAMVGIFFI